MWEDGLLVHRKKLIVIGSLLVALIIGVSLFFIIYNKLHSVTLKIMVAPSIAKVMINEKEYKTLGEYKIMPGEYEVVVSAEGFETKTGTLHAVADETVKVQLYLEPNEDNLDWYNDHPDDGLILGEIKYNNAVESTQEVLNNNSFLREFPIKIDYYTNNYSKRVQYTIDYVMDNNTVFHLLITDYSGGNRSDAINRLKTMGVDVDKLKIEYKDVSSEYKTYHAG